MRIADGRSSYPAGKKISKTELQKLKYEHDDFQGQLGLRHPTPQRALR